MTKARFRIEVDLPGVPPLNAADSFHWRKRDRLRKKWLKIVCSLVPRSKLPKPRPLPHAHVTIIRCTSVAGDGDNLPNGGKWIVDAAVKVGLIQNDAPANIGKVSHKWRRTAPRKSHTILIVEECSAFDVDTSDWEGL